MSAFTQLTLTQIASALQYVRGRLGSTQGDALPPVTFEYEKVIGVNSSGVMTDMYGVSSSIPQADTGSGSSGTSYDLSRGDHAHPTDSTRAPVANPSFTTKIYSPLGLIGSNANFTDFTAASFVSSHDDTGHTYTGNIGIVGEANATSSVLGTGIGGAAKTTGSFDARGVVGMCRVDATGNTGDAIGVYGYSSSTHSGADNIAVQGYAVNGLVNYSFYGIAGIIYNVDDIKTGGSYFVDGIKVVGNQVVSTGLDAQTDTNKITAIIAALRAHGLLGPNA